MSHTNAAPVPRARPHAVRLGVEGGCPVALAAHLGMAAWAAHAARARCWLNRIGHVGVHIGELIRCDELDHPGALVHVDVDKLGSIPHGGGWRSAGRGHGARSRVAAGKTKNAWHNPKIGTAFVRTVIDDHSRPVIGQVARVLQFPASGAVVLRGLRIQTVTPATMAYRIRVAR